MILKIQAFKSIVFKLTLLCFLPAFSSYTIARSINIGIVLDGTSKRGFLPIEQIKQEIVKLNQAEFSIHFPADKVINADWQIDKVRAAINTLNQDKSIDLIITQGLMASHEAAHFSGLKKAVIAPVVADRILQKFPYKNG